MKRSEAIRAIAIQMHIVNGTITQNPSHYYLKFAESALNTMEQLGMKPPYVYVPGGPLSMWDQEEDNDTLINEGKRSGAV